MKAAVLDRYDIHGRALVVKDVPKPVPANHEVLVKIKAAAVNPLDNMIIRGEVKLIVPYETPLIMGNEFAGVVESVGVDVSEFKAGNRVYGRMPLKKIGAFAEYAVIDQNAIALIPEYLSYEEAATVPLTALTAMQAFEVMHAQRGETIFISGGTGSVGSMAIPIANSMGLHVITSGSADNMERVKNLGAERFIDYRSEDYAEVISEVDLVLDTLGEKEIPKEFGILRKGGRLVSLRGLPNGRFAVRSGMSGIKRILFGIAGRKYDRMAAKKNQVYDFLFVHEDGHQLARIGQIFDEEHKLETSVDAVYTLDEINEALEKVRTGRSKGKTIIRIESNWP